MSSVYDYSYLNCNKIDFAENRYSIHFPVFFFFFVDFSHIAFQLREIVKNDFSYGPTTSN